jgi:hypothetical protein
MEKEVAHVGHWVMLTTLSELRRLPRRVGREFVVVAPTLLEEET